MQLFRGLTVAVVSLLLTSGVRAEGVFLPKGTIITTPAGVRTDLPDVRFMVERADLDYYNALQIRFDALDVANQQCEEQVLALRQAAPPSPTFWDTWIGRSVLIAGAVVVGVGVGYILGR